MQQQEQDKLSKKHAFATPHWNWQIVINAMQICYLFALKMEVKPATLFGCATYDWLVNVWYSWHPEYIPRHFKFYKTLLWCTILPIPFHSNHRQHQNISYMSYTKLPLVMLVSDKLLTATNYAMHTILLHRMQTQLRRNEIIVHYYMHCAANFFVLYKSTKITRDSQDLTDLLEPKL